MEIRAVDFGGLGGVDALDPGLPRLTPLYSGLTKAFKDEGYEERKDLFGAPYDFRLAADGLEQVLLAHTLRCPGVKSNTSGHLSNVWTLSRSRTDSTSISFLACAAQDWRANPHLKQHFPVMGECHTNLVELHVLDEYAQEALTLGYF